MGAATAADLLRALPQDQEVQCGAGGLIRFLFVHPVWDRVVTGWLHYPIMVTVLVLTFLEAFLLHLKRIPGSCTRLRSRGTERHTATCRINTRGGPSCRRSTGRVCIQMEALGSASFFASTRGIIKVVDDLATADMIICQLFVVGMVTSMKGRYFVSITAMFS